MSERPSGLGRTPTAPPVMANGHFATIGDSSDVTSYEHGVQVIDGDKEFKYDPLTPGCCTRLQLQVCEQSRLCARA